MSDIPVVRVNGDDYYVNGDPIYLTVNDGKLVNFGNSNITLSSSIRSGTSQAQVYPYITCNSMRTCVLYRSAQQSQELSVSSYSVVNRGFYDPFSSIYILFAILGVLVCLLFKR